MPSIFATHKRRLRWIAAAFLLILASFGLSGCPALLIPGLGYSAYQGYEYVKKASPGSTNKSQASVQTNSSS